MIKNINIYRRAITKSNGWLLLTLFLFVVLSVLVFKSNIFSSLSISKKKEMIDYVVRFMIFELPASITIFSFVYKEKKDASYSNIKTSNIWSLFIWTISFSLTTLIFSVITATKTDPALKDEVLSTTHFLITIIYAVISMVLLGFYISSLIRNMDIRYSLHKTIKKTKVYHELLIDFYKKENNKSFSKYQYLITSYNHLIESNFQLIMAAMSRKNLSDIQSELKEIFALSKDFYGTFIDVESVQDLSKFMNIEMKKNSNKDKKNQIYNKENLIDIYNNILLNYKLLIRESSKMGMTVIQKQAYSEFSSLNPVKFYSYDFEQVTQEEFNNLLEFYNEIIKSYHTSLFETMKEFSNENTVEYSYLLEKVSDSSEFFEDLAKNEQFSSKNAEVFYKSLLDKNLTLLEAIIVSPIELGNVKFLTESTNILLRFYYTHIQYPDYQSKMIRNKLKKDDKSELEGLAFINQYIDANEDIKNSERVSNPYFKMEIANSIIRIIIRSLHKSIELGHYQCTGYLTKISCSHLTIKNFLNSIVEYTSQIVEREIISHDLDYYHYSINNFSKIHCIQKMILILAFQIISRYGNSNFELLKNTIRSLCLEEEFEYMLEKVESADKSYGMISISSENKEKLNQIFTEEKQAHLI